MNSRIYVFGLVGLSSLAIFVLLAQPGLLSAKSTLGNSDLATLDSSKQATKSTSRLSGSSAKEDSKESGATKAENLAALTSTEVEKLEHHHQ